MVADHNNNNNNNRGFLNKMNFRKNMRNQKRTSPATVAATTTDVPEKVELTNRRIIKATPPPTPTTEDPTITNDSEEKDDGGNTIGGGGMGVGGADIALRSVQDETLREKTEQWRQERLDASAAIRKGKKEKEVSEHRHRESSTVTVTTSNTTNKTSTSTATAAAVGESTPMEVPAVLTTASEFPEHKRKASSRDEHDGKKIRVDESTPIADDNSVAAGKEEDWKSTAMKIIKQSAAPAAIVGIVAIVAMRMLRAKR